MGCGISKPIRIRKYFYIMYMLFYLHLEVINKFLYIKKRKEKKRIENCSKGWDSFKTLL